MPDMIDWRALLIRYMAKIIDRESVNLAEAYSPTFELTTTEVKILNSLEKSALNILAENERK